MAISHLHVARRGIVAPLLAWVGAGVLLLALHSGQAARAQEHEGALLAAHWTAEDGLPVLAVRSVIQTRDGYLWLATYDGLVRFDGHRFTVFDSGNTPALTSDRILYLFESSGGNLWIHTEAGHLVRYQDGTFTRYGPEQHFGNAPVTTYHVDVGGGIWAATSEGLYHLVDDQFERFAPDVLQYEPIAFHEARDGAFWVGTKQGGAFRFQGTHLTTRTRTAVAPPQSVPEFWEGPQDTLWFRTDEGVGSYADGHMRPHVATAEAWTTALEARLETPVQRLGDPRDGAPFLYAPGYPQLYDFLPRLQELIYHVVPGPRGRDWFLHENTLYRDSTAVFEADGKLTGLAFDHEGNLWLSSEVGLYRLYPAPFTTYGPEDGMEVASANAYGVIESRDGTIWTALLGGGVLRYHPAAAQDASRLTHLAKPELALTLHEDSDGIIWVGHYDGLCRIRPDGDVCRPVPSFQGMPVRAIIRHDDALWVGTENGLFRQEHASGSWAHFTPADGLSGKHVRVFLVDRHRALWMGTRDGGLTRYHEGRFTTVGTEDGLSSDIIRALYQDADGTIWVGTENNGLNRIALDAGTGLPRHVAAIRRVDGLYDDGIHQILEDDQNRLWMSTNRGIFHVARAAVDAVADGRRARVYSTVYDQDDGLASREANGGVHGAGIRARNGRLWFPTQAGLAVVDPSAVDDSPPPLSVVIEAVRFADSTTVRPEALVLPLGLRRLEIQFSAPAFLDPQAVVFQYRLAGLDPTWVDAGSHRTATYTNVPPGRYRFEVRAGSVSGVWSTEQASMALRVPPYFFETNWFALLMLLGLLGGTAATYRWRLRRVQQHERELEMLVAVRTREVESQKDQLALQADQLRALDEAKSRFFTNVSHEFRTPLTLSMGPMQELRTQLSEDADAQALVNQSLLNNRRLLRLVNQLLDVARLEAGSLHLAVRPIRLQPYLSTLVQAFVGLAERKRIDFRHRYPDALVTVYADPDHLEKVITNLLSNAFKFTPAGGSITLTLETVDADAVIAVRDTGAGIPAGELPHVFDRFYQAGSGGRVQQAGTGIGLALAKELVELHGGCIEVANPPGEGTTFIVRIPTGKACFVARDGVAVSEVPLEVASYGSLGDGSAAPTPPTPASEQDDDAEDRTTVLVVDDNAEIRAYVRRHLAPHYRVREAADGAAALAAAREMTPDVIVSDVMMPEMDGVTLVRALRADPELDFVPVILLTARAEQEEKIEGLEAGADDYLTKPFDVHELLVRVRALIDLRHRLQRQLRQQADAPQRDDAALPEIVSEEQAFIAQLHDVVAAHLSDEDFGVDALAAALGTSRATLYRRLRAATDRTPAEVLRTARLEQAERLLRAGAGNVSEVAYAVGFRSVPHFTSSFRDHAGQTPAQYAAAHASS